MISAQVQNTALIYTPMFAAIFLANIVFVRRPNLHWLAKTGFAVGILISIIGGLASIIVGLGFIINFRNVDAIWVSLSILLATASCLFFAADILREGMREDTEENATMGKVMGMGIAILIILYLSVCCLIIDFVFPESLPPTLKWYVLFLNKTFQNIFR